MNNLNFLFQNSQPSDSETLSVLDGEVVLFKRPHSQYWQSRFKLENGQWHHASTGSDQIAEATTRSIAIYETVKAKISNGLPVTRRTFRRIAEDELASLANLKNISNQTRNDYIYIITNYLIPFFGRHQVDEITEEMVADFSSWRISKMGRVPMKDTQRYHSTTYNRIINRARASGFIGQHQEIPGLLIDGEKGKPRPGFSRQEIDHLIDFMEYWDEYKRYGRTERSRKMQILCRCYVEFLLYTGARPGTETMPLKWKDLQWHLIGKRKYLRVWVSGKTGPRYLIAKDDLWPSLTRLMKWQGLPYKSLDQLLAANVNKLIFAMPEGDQPYGLEGVFERLMKDSELLKDHTGQRRTLYSLRHTYATFALADGVDIHTVARQMGTSVLMLEKHYSKLTPMLSAEKLA
jgi:integrase